MPAQQMLQPAPPVQSELSRQWCGRHHLGPDPTAFATQVWMNSSLAGSASILCAASIQAICASTSHRFTKLRRTSPASLCSVAFALQVWSAAGVVMTTPQSTKITARDRISHAGAVKSWLGHFDLVRANRNREPRMSSQIPTRVRTNRMTMPSQRAQRNIAPITPP
jgi:hypothetical protein